MAKVVMIIAPENYQDIEYETPKKILENAGHTVDTASTVTNPQGARVGNTQSDLLLEEVKAENYDAVIFVGGGGSFIYFNDPIAHEIAKNFYESEKLICAICAAPTILARAGLLKGKKATCFPSQQEDLQVNGAIYTENPVEQDGKIITANGPKSAQEFGQRIAKMI